MKMFNFKQFLLLICLSIVTNVQAADPYAGYYSDFIGISVDHVQKFLEKFDGDLKDTNLSSRFNLDENGFYGKVSNWNEAGLRNGISNMSPAALIWYSAKENNINPVLLLAKIQGEQSLIEKLATQHTLNRATGYGIPNNNSSGDPKYASFFAQIIGLTFQFNKDKEDGKTFREAYDSYTHDPSGQDASFQRFVNLYMNYAGVMSKVLENQTPNLQVTSFVIEPKPLKQNYPVKVTVAVMNKGNTSFTGKIAVALHNLDGSWKGDIQVLETSILANQSQSFTFSKDTINSAPDSYRLRLNFLPNGIQNWDILYDVPIDITSPNMSIEQKSKMLFDTLEQNPKLSSLLDPSNEILGKGKGICKPSGSTTICVRGYQKSGSSFLVGSVVLGNKFFFITRTGTNPLKFIPSIQGISLDDANRMFCNSSCW